jgi:hypothetical protein
MIFILRRQKKVPLRVEGYLTPVFVSMNSSGEAKNSAGRRRVTQCALFLSMGALTGVIILGMTS